MEPKDNGNSLVTDLPSLVTTQTKPEQDYCLWLVVLNVNEVRCKTIKITDKQTCITRQTELTCATQSQFLTCLQGLLTTCLQQLFMV